MNEQIANNADAKWRLQESAQRFRSHEREVRSRIRDSQIDLVRDSLLTRANEWASRASAIEAQLRAME